MKTKPVDRRLIDAILWGNRVEVLQAVKEGADVRAKDEYGNDIVLVAGGLSQWVIVDDLLILGADVEARNSRFGYRLMHFAAEEGDWEAVCRLLRCKASVNCVNNYGETPLDLALSKRHSRVVELLKQNGARFKDSLHHVGDIAHKIAAQYTLQHFGEEYACVCYHGLSKHGNKSGRCDGVTRHPNGDEELCTCDAFADVWGRAVPVHRLEYRTLFGDYDLESSQ